MSKMEAEDLFTLGMETLKNGETGAALELLKKAVSLERNPLYCSNLAVCLAKEKRDFKQAISLCKEAIRKEPKNSIHFLNLGRVHILADQKRDALRIFSMGLRNENNQDIIAEMKKFDRRRPPIISFLERSNPINKALGKIFYKQRNR
ncbi:MAG TPA: tetratricopeptide repeat protein [Geobacteraceae bacterium]|nr:tetratricopeptide repeat protein [Geobacteraceae bacterium]